ncbi:MAG TPA: hypothetical protein PKA44_08360 [Saprospiraceae bacterium]|jgi:hypothetical protein|nr:hypothetical protein [Saprospiraceae bacterium]HMU59911.1 hypothetical protein [Chitinophagaceae bacterium]
MLSTQNNEQAPVLAGVFLRLALSILLLLCLLKMPYGFYQLVRYIATVVFVLLAIDSSKSIYLQTTFIALAILFQPFIKISLGRTVWNIVDVIVAAFLILSAVAEIFKNKKKK